MASVDPLKPGFTAKDIQLLRNMVPVHTLPEEVFSELLQDLQIESLAKNEILVREGDTEQLSYYLLEGSLSLLEGGQVVDTVVAGEESARFPIAHVLPRKNTVRTDSRVRIARLDSRRISELLARTHQEAYEVDHIEEAEPDDWMSLLLQSPVLQQLPASNIQRVMMNISQCEVEQGEQIIRQGDPGDYFYMLIQGRAVVTREEPGGDSPRELAQLEPGDAFGEEALLSDNPRNSTITMQTQGQVLRLAKSDFLELVQSPLVRHIDFDDAVRKVEKGAVWIDLRSPEDYEHDHFPGSVNLPVESLRYQISSLAPERHYVLYSNSGGRAAVAAYLLMDQGFDISLLKGGLKRLREEQPEELLPEPPSEEQRWGSGQESSELQRRVQEAEQRARELENQLKVAEASVQDAEQQNQQHLAELKGAVDKARERLQASEEEKSAALADAQQAYSEMEALTSSLERLASERTALADRMHEIEGLDKKMQARLEKAERELIGEREQAESAIESLNEIGRRLNEVVHERELEREHHARETGQLKEEVTCLKLELEQAMADLDALRAEHEGADTDALAGGAGPGEASAGQTMELESLRQELAEKADQLVEAEFQVATQAGELAQLQEQSAAQQAQLAAFEAAGGEDAEMSARSTELGHALAERTDELRQLREVLEQAKAQQDAYQREKDELAAELAQRQHEVDELRSVMEAHVEQIRAAQEVNLAQEAADDERVQLGAELELARQELRQMQEGLNDRPDAAEVEAMRQALHDTRRSLEERQSDLAQAEVARHQLEDTLEDAHAEIDRLRKDVDRLATALKQAEEHEVQASSARARLEEEIGHLKQQAVELDLGDIQEEVPRFGSKPLDVEALDRPAWASRFIPLVAGGGTVFLLLEAMSFIAGHGELISILMNF